MGRIVYDEIIPETCEQALAQWDAGQSVFTVEMGGIGPGYEQCIQVLVFELLRDAINGAIPMVKAGDRLVTWGDSTVDRLNDRLGFSGAQVGAAKNLASGMLVHGYRKAVNSVEKGRHIQASKGFTR
jgi:hypothetical protein